MTFIVTGILVLLVATALLIARLRDLWACIMATGIYSFLGAGWMLLLDAPDVAFTEAAVGAGVATVLMLTTLSLTGCQPRPRNAARSAIGLVVVGVTGAALVYGTLDMPNFGDPGAPIHRYPAPSYVQRTQGDMHGLPNVVTAVLASYRGYDTFGETTVILTAGIAVLLILVRDQKVVASQNAIVNGAQATTPNETAGLAVQDAAGMNAFPVIRVVSKILIPYILLFGFYVQFHGDYGPGGGFQAGVVVAAAVILYGLVFGLDAARRVAPMPWVQRGMALGVLLYAAAGLLCMIRGGKFLDYDYLEHGFGNHRLPSGQHLGIFLVELGVGVTVTSVMIAIFLTFAGYRRSESMA